MTARSIRRAAERKAAKLIRKQQRQAPGTAPVEAPIPPPGDTTSRVEPTPASQAPLAATPGNAKPRRYTGPTSAAGKAICSLNRLKHGLTGIFRVLESESQSEFDELRDALRSEYSPVGPTETLLVDRLAEYIWLSQRAQRLQDHELVNGNENALALFMRYQTTNDRAFYRCLRELQVLGRERREFESQNARPTPQTPSVKPSAAAPSPAPEVGQPNDTQLEWNSNRKTAARAAGIVELNAHNEEFGGS